MLLRLPPLGVQGRRGGRPREGFAQATKIGDRFGDPQLIALGRVGEGRCRIYLGEIVAGMALLDEAMVAITAHEVSPARSETCIAR